jgi:hypothetical protein
VFLPIVYGEKTGRKLAEEDANEDKLVDTIGDAGAIELANYGVPVEGGTATG